MPAAEGRAKARGGWHCVDIRSIDQMSDAVMGAGLDAIQMNSGPFRGALAFRDRGRVTLRAGRIGGSCCAAPLSERRVTVGMVLRAARGLAKFTHFGAQPAGFEFGARCWADAPEGGPDGWGLRAAVTLLFTRYRLQVWPGWPGGAARTVDATDFQTSNVLTAGAFAGLTKSPNIKWFDQ